jgi:hypothetical protein
MQIPHEVLPCRRHEQLVLPQLEITAPVSFSLPNNVVMPR